jgi:hypothetical protein
MELVIPRRADSSDAQVRLRVCVRASTASALLALACLASVCGPAIAGGPPPVVACGSDGSGQHCLVSRLPPVIADREVTPYLKSGLTATFVITLATKDSHGRRMASIMRIEVRFEPWDEVFFVTWVRPGMVTEQLRLASEEKLQSWWGALKLPFTMARAVAGDARLEVSLNPFSGEEERDTRQWYAEALRVDRRQADDRRLDRDLSRVGEMFDAMTLTSIKRRGVLRFEWSVSVERVQ